jgi:phospholipid/cholesterol/gamma-HCH transport system permease protein
MNGLRRAGMAATTLGGLAVYIVAVTVGALWLAVLPRSWPRTVRQVFSRQLLFTGYDAIGLTMRIAFAVGLLVIVQIELWLRSIADADLSGQLFLRIFLRELGPFLANLIVIIRSGTAIATELARMKVDGDIEVLETQGIDPMNYLVMPRVLGVGFSVFGLAVILVSFAFISGYVVGTMIGVINASPYEFVRGILRQLQTEDVLFFLPKTLLTGFVVGSIACITGLEIQDRDVEIPQMAGRAAVRSLMAVFFVAMLLSLSVYGRVLVFQVF